MKVALISFISLVVLVMVNDSIARLRGCGSVTGKTLKFNISACPDLSKECILVEGSNITASIEFLSETVSDYVFVTFLAYHFVVRFDLITPKTDACETGLQCPIQNGETYMYNISTHVPEVGSRHSKQPYIFHFMLQDKKFQRISCVQFDGRFRKF